MNMNAVTLLTHQAVTSRWAWRHALDAALAVLRRPAATPEETAWRQLLRDAAAVRALADRYRPSDPGFASDLQAAADRHERQFAERYPATSG